MAYASILASSTVWRCSPFASTVGFSSFSLAAFYAADISGTIGGSGGGIVASANDVASILALAASFNFYISDLAGGTIA
jgi:hypothetical protein